eukprot:gnl/MRDRNA2_/MRDRNA2_86521_c1_seq7.p1 gnl/MRDRNA2_/MRDRNA2_86521_c1~~gnl/MRDRNA2_/MRDRNA2_86521_c1_seq7.p1  ORF type:complete len:410 (+),score=76.68 gnl/MRDRNA2_/MRDRNA2_86521_c1_seq7:88-1317(+)
MITVIRQKKQREKELKRALAARKRASEAARQSSVSQSVVPLSGPDDGVLSIDTKPIRNILPFQSKVRRWYISDKIQISVAVLIFLNFLVSIIRAQVPDGDAEAADDFNDNPLKVKAFLVLEFIFNGIFAVELVINIYGHWFKPFWESAWNVFDFLVVVTSLTSMFVKAIPGFSVLRLFRAFRVFRLFRRIPALKKITSGVVASLTGVSSAVFLLSLVMGIWSIMGKNFFGEEFPDLFGNFFKAMLSMFQVMSYDSWSSGITRPVVFKFSPSPIAPIFFVTYVFISAIIMANVVLAILLDKFLAAAAEFESAEKEENGEEDGSKQGILPFDDIMARIEDPGMFVEIEHLKEFEEAMQAKLTELHGIVQGPLRTFVVSQKNKAYENGVEPKMGCCPIGNSSAKKSSRIAPA